MKPGSRALQELVRFGRDPQSYWDSWKKDGRGWCTSPLDWDDWHNLSGRPWRELRDLHKRGLLDLRVIHEKCGSGDNWSRLMWQARANGRGRHVIELYGATL